MYKVRTHWPRKVKWTKAEDNREEVARVKGYSGRASYAKRARYGYFINNLLRQRHGYHKPWRASQILYIELFHRYFP